MTTILKISKEVRCASILLAVFADTQVLNLIMVAANPSLAGIFMTVLYSVVVVGLFCLGLFVEKRSFASLSSSHIGICFLCVLWYIATAGLIAEPSVSVSYFGIFMVAAFLLPGIIRIDTRVFLLSLFILPSVGIFFLNQIFYNEILESGVVSMGTCYAFLIPVLANLVFLFFYQSKEKKIFKIVVLFFTSINIFYLVQMTMYGSRGPILCVLFFLLSTFIIKTDELGNVLLRKKRLFFILVGIVLVVLSFVVLLQWLSEVLSSFDISLGIIDKTLRLEDNGGISNSRNEILNTALKGFIDSPLLGNGIAQFERNTGYVYPHNFILQMLYDGGLVLTFGVILPIVNNLFNKIYSWNKAEFVCLLFFFFASVPGALLSGDLWNAGMLWLFFGFILSKKSFYSNVY